MRKCQCGCGEEITNNRWKYKRGHAPQHSAAAPGPKPEVEVATAAEQSADDSEESSWTLSLTLTDSQIEFHWQTLTPQEKAAAIQFALENR